MHCTGYTVTEYMGLERGEITGVYYQAGGAIVQIMNPQQGSHAAIHIIVESTAGSAYNINTVETGTFPLGIVQSDSQFFAMNGMVGIPKNSFPILPNSKHFILFFQHLQLLQC